ncbi:MAG: histidine kinase [Caulobacteraceae bacterium]
MRRLFLLSWLLLAFASWASSSQALVATTRLTQYGRRTWHIGDAGLPGSPLAIAQTTDGYIWVGATDGLYRFDGVAFKHWTPPAGPLTDFREVLTLLGASDGSLYAGWFNGLVRVSGKSVHIYPNKFQIPGPFFEDGEGKIWFSHLGYVEYQTSICGINGNAVKCYGPDQGVNCKNGNSVSYIDKGELIFGGWNGLCRWRPGQVSEMIPWPVGVSSRDRITDIVHQADGSLLIAFEGRGLFRLSGGKWTSQIAPDVDGARFRVRQMIVDRTGAVWIGTFADGLYRLSSGRLEHFGVIDGLSGNSVTGLLEDREGSVWVTTPFGLDQFYDLPIITFTSREGLVNAGEVGGGAEAAEGGIWVAGGHSIVRINGDSISSVTGSSQFGKAPLSWVFEYPHGHLWTLSGHQPEVYDGKLHPIKAPNGLRCGEINASGTAYGDVVANCYDRSTEPWTAALWRFRDRRFVGSIPSPMLDGKPTAIDAFAPDLTGGFWLGVWRHGLFRRVDGVERRVDAIPQDEIVVTIIPIRRDEAWLAAMKGIIWLRQGQSRRLDSKDGLPCDSAIDINFDSTGDLWASMRCGLVEISSTDLSRWRSDPKYIVHPTVFTSEDGYRYSAGKEEDLIRTSDGRIWMVDSDDVRVLDANNIHYNTTSPPVHIDRLVVDHADVAVSPRVVLPVLNREVEIDYDGLSFVHPDRLHFRYRLIGHDRAWNEVGARRQAFYTDLRPGAYRFEVAVCNEDRACSGAPAAIGLTVPPAWYQSLAFKLGCGLAILAALYIGICWRIHILSDRVRLRFHERLNERARVARDLHDTLMQTLFASKIMADTARRHMPPASPGAAELHQLSASLAQGVKEAREAIDALRASATETDDLAGAFELAAAEALEGQDVSVRVVVEGSVRAIDPTPRHEIYRIGCEAIRNAALHSGASSIEITLAYGFILRLKIRDNGQGMAPDMLARGKPSHFGLVGMRERAQHIGADLKITGAHGGVEVVLTVPGHVIFEHRPGRTRLFAAAGAYLKRLIADRASKGFEAP